MKNVFYSLNILPLRFSDQNTTLVNLESLVYRIIRPKVQNTNFKSNQFSFFNYLFEKDSQHVTQYPCAFCFIYLFIFASLLGLLSSTAACEVCLSCLFLNRNVSLSCLISPEEDSHIHSEKKLKK